MLVEDEHHAQVLRGRGTVEQHELPQLRAGGRNPGDLQIVDDRLEGEVEDLEVAGDVAFDHLQQVPGRLLGLVVGVSAQVEEHDARDREHADRGEHAERDPRPSEPEPAREGV